MGLTRTSVGKKAAKEALIKNENEHLIALAGCPNVGKSTVFNALTGMNQHTGNWAGKTVGLASGTYSFGGEKYRLADIPGTYSLVPHSAEEEVAKNFICCGRCEAAVVVCDATAMEKSLFLALQVASVIPKTIICVNLLDEATRKGIKIDLNLLSEITGLPVCGVVAQKKKTLTALCKKIQMLLDCESNNSPPSLDFPTPIKTQLDYLQEKLSDFSKEYGIFPQLLAQNLLEGFELPESKYKALGALARKNLFDKGFNAQRISDSLSLAYTAKSEAICSQTVTKPKQSISPLDKYFCGKYTAFPIMLLFLALILWITLVGANYPSNALSDLFSLLEAPLHKGLSAINLPPYICDAAVYGAYRVLSWVVAVMLPPMAIFFPLFTLLEDWGYLPRIAYNLDRPFQACRACGKQALTMCMGFGCNAAGVVGCRIIDSKRERLLAILTNSFVPCNGRFPMMIAIITLFFARSKGFLTLPVLLLFVILAVFATFFATFVLSKTFLRGTPSPFILELPPYRKPQVGKIIIRSIFDRTLHVLSRAAAVAAPAGLLIWIFANIKIGNTNILCHMANLLDPIGEFMGLDGEILTGFILGLPANEIVVPIILMIYMSTGSLSDMGTLEMGRAFENAGWDTTTAICFLIFTLMHWPCSTTVATVYKETKSIKWTLLSAALPTVMGVITCILINFISKLF